MECRNDTECAPTQCCYIQPEFLVVSRRVAANPLVVALQPPHTKHDTGNFDKARFHCYEGIDIAVVLTYRSQLPLLSALRLCYIDPKNHCNNYR